MKASFIERLKAALFVFNNLQDYAEYGTVYKTRIDDGIMAVFTNNHIRGSLNDRDADEAFENHHPTKYRKEEISYFNPPELVLFIRPMKEFHNA